MGLGVRKPFQFVKRRRPRLRPTSEWRRRSFSPSSLAEGEPPPLPDADDMELGGDKTRTKSPEESITLGINLVDD